jgi:UDP-glucose 4-epimerase
VKALITGGTGFVGQAVSRRLIERGHEVVLLARQSSSVALRPLSGVHRPTATDGLPAVVLGDLRDRAAIGRVIGDGGFDGIVHLAALTRVRDSLADPIGYFETNVGGTGHLLAALDEQARRTGRPARLVFASTGAVYGNQEGRLDEQTPTRPAHPYAAAKLAAEQLIGFQTGTGRLVASSLRCFNVAGALPGLPDRDLSRLIPKALAVAAGAGQQLQVHGDGSALREYTHVADVADAYVLALEAVTVGHRVFNVGSGTGVSVNQVIDAVRRVTGCPVPVDRRPAGTESKVVTADSALIRAELGWRPERSELDRLIMDGWSARRA